LINIQAIYDLLFLDIETVPQESEDVNLPADRRQLFFDKISKTVPENFDEAEVYKQKAGILAEFGKVICISTGYLYLNKEGAACMKLKSICNDDEKTLLLKFIELVNQFHRVKPKFQFAGHNIREFDVPFLCRRMIIHNIPLPSYLQIHGAKPWEVNMVDTMQWWKFGDYKNFTSLHLLANVLNIPSSKNGIDGSKVQEVYYKENDLPRIVEYCQRDVVVVARIVQRFHNLPIVADENVLIAE
jgi:DNA polymerase elongation subunit (family B)